jgi:hypothetical protein
MSPLIANLQVSHDCMVSVSFSDLTCRIPSLPPFPTHLLAEYLKGNTMRQSCRSMLSGPQQSPPEELNNEPDLQGFRNGVAEWLRSVTWQLGLV